MSGKLKTPSARAEVIFQPGPGRPPPHLAGREDEQSMLATCMREVQGGRPPPNFIVLYGPRGNGKTALLTWFRREISATAPGVETLWITPSETPTVAALFEALTPSGQWSELRRRLAGLKLNIGGIGAGVELATAAAPGGRLLAEMLSTRCGEAPLIVVLDEAHTLQPAVGHVLLNAMQKVYAEQPFLLVLAGTPGLPDLLSQINAAFWDRCHERGIGLLSPSASREALSKPLAEQGVRISEEALERVEADAGGYPYFIQLWGEALWAQVRDTDRCLIDRDDAEAAGSRARDAKDAYYLKRYKELVAPQAPPGALLVAAALTEALASKGGAPAEARLSNAEVNQAAQSALPPGGDLNEMVRFLSRCGYVWQLPVAGAPWTAGIPSLANYILREARAGQ